MDRRYWIRNAALGLLTLPLLDSLLPLAAQEGEDYQSPYSLKFRHPVEELEVGFQEAPWNTPHEEAVVPHGDWYSRAVERRWGAWGPPARQYPPAPGLERRSATWLQDRVILTASRWIGTPYQHHHVPDWNPPAHWPWLKVAYGRNSKGIDCSNFSSFYYNYGLGLKLDTGIRQQAERVDVRGPGGHGSLRVERIEPAPYDELVQQLQPADLLYIKNDAGKLAHVIMWLGEVGVSPDGTPLVLDSTGGGHKDSAGNPIPIGIHIRPFGKRSWYAKDFSHAHRLIHAVHHVRNEDAAEAAEGGADQP